MRDVIRAVAGTDKPIVMIAHSGGALISGIIINENPDLNIRNWITVAGVLNHADWTSFFGDSPLARSQNMDMLPRVSGTHYAARGDIVVPNSLSIKWLGDDGVTILDGARHDKFPMLDFSGF